VFISAVNTENAKRALAVIETIAKDPEVGSIYKGRVTRLMAFGAFVEIAPGKEGLVHISKLDVKRVEKVEDALQIGQEISAEVLELDAENKKISLSIKKTVERPVKEAPAPVVEEAAEEAAPEEEIPVVQEEMGSTLADVFNN
jgi:polyribonucleotide nucleotidyltransferase